MAERKCPMCHGTGKVRDREGFGALVHKYRVEAGLTQGELADQIGLQRTSVTNIEKGRQEVTLTTLMQIAVALKVTPATLIPSKESPK